MIKTLLVDDHALVRAGMSMLLSSLSPDIDVSEAPDVDSALAILRDQPDMTLVLLDLQMPGFVDLQALLHIRKHAEDVPVVVLSGDDREHLVHDAIEAGAMGFIHKSIEPKAMLLALDVIMSGGVYLPQGVVMRSAEAVTARPSPETTKQKLAEMGITDRQADALFGVVQGKSNKVIARELHIAESTVKSHLIAVYNSFGVNTRTQLVYEVARRGLTWS